MAAATLTALRLDRHRARVEHERLRRQDDREQRKERGAAYYRTVILLNRLDRFATGNPPDEDRLSATIEEYDKSVSALRLSASCRSSMRCTTWKGSRTRSATR
jgi:hypothetical protein